MIKQLNLTEETIVDNKKFLYTFFLIAIPIILQQLITISLISLDNFMVGSLGVEAIASVGFANRIVFIFILMIFGATGGCGIFIAQYFGKKDYETIRKIFAFMMLIAITMSIIFFSVCIYTPTNIIRLFSHDEAIIVKGSSFLVIVAMSFPFLGITTALTTTLRSMGFTRLPLYVSIIITIINAFLNYGLIFGHLNLPKLDTDGSATATLVARIIECLLLVIIVIKYRTTLHLNAKLEEFFGLGKNLLKLIIKTSVPIFFTETIWVLGTVALTAAYATLGTKAVTAVQISDNVLNMSSIIFLGVSAASSVMVAQLIGQGNKHLAIKASRKILVCSKILGLISVVLALLLIHPILMIYTLPIDVYNQAKNVLVVMSLVLFIKMQNWTTLIGILRAGGDTQVAFLIDTVFLIGFAVPCAFLLTEFTHLAVHWIVLLVNIEELIKFIISNYRYYSNKWIHNLTQVNNE